MGNHFALAIQTKYQAKCRDLPLKQYIKILRFIWLVNWEVSI